VLTCAPASPLQSGARPPAWRASAATSTARISSSNGGDRSVWFSPLAAPARLPGLADHLVRGWWRLWLPQRLSDGVGGIDTRTDDTGSGSGAGAGAEAEAEAGAGTGTGTDTGPGTDTGTGTDTDQRQRGLAGGKSMEHGLPGIDPDRESCEQCAGELESDVRARRLDRQLVERDPFEREFPAHREWCGLERRDSSRWLRHIRIRRRLSGRAPRAHLVPVEWPGVYVRRGVAATAAAPGTGATAPCAGAATGAGADAAARRWSGIPLDVGPGDDRLDR